MAIIGNIHYFQTNPYIYIYITGIQPGAKIEGVEEPAIWTNTAVKWGQLNFPWFCLKWNQSFLHVEHGWIHSFYLKVGMNQNLLGYFVKISMRICQLFLGFTREACHDPWPEAKVYGLLCCVDLSPDYFFLVLNDISIGDMYISG